MWSLGEKSGHLEENVPFLRKNGLGTSEVLLQGQQQHKHNQPMQNQDQSQVFQRLCKCGKKLLEMN